MDAWTPPIVVEAEQQNPGDHAAAHWLLRREDSPAAALSLVRPDGVSLTVEFTEGKTRHRTTESGRGAQALSKALGIRQFLKIHNHFPGIIDATGGLGQDAWALASLGCTVLLFEQHPVIHALLADGIKRALEHPEYSEIAQRLQLLHGDATQELNARATANVHAIYLDPMYPDKRKKSSSKKGMQFLHALLGPPGEDDPALLLGALSYGASRVAVKRPKGAPMLAGTDQFTGQRTAIESPNTRYDVYHCYSR